MEVFWQVFWGALGGGALLIAILGFLGKAIVGQLLAKDLERFRNQLQVAAAERNVIFEKLHSQQANIIAKTYSLITALTSELNGILKKVEADKEYKRVPPDTAQALVKKLRKYHTENRIWLPIDLADRLEELLCQAEMAITEADLVSPEIYLIENELWSFTSQLIDMAKDLENEFRKILGSDSQYIKGSA